MKLASVFIYLFFIIGVSLITIHYFFEKQSWFDALNGHISGPIVIACCLFFYTTYITSKSASDKIDANDRARDLFMVSSKSTSYVKYIGPFYLFAVWAGCSALTFLSSHRNDVFLPVGLFTFFQFMLSVLICTNISTLHCSSLDKVFIINYGPKQIAFKNHEIIRIYQIFTQFYQLKTGKGNYYFISSFRDVYINNEILLNKAKQLAREPYQIY